jgi:hypothetical protein
LFHPLAPFPGSFHPPFSQSKHLEQFLDSSAPLPNRHVVDPPVELQVVFGAQMLINAGMLQQYL